MFSPLRSIILTVYEMTVLTGLKTFTIYREVVEIFLKMSILEKIQQLQPNEVRLYREGMFWVAYEHSA
jgi:hypothetical protein